MPTAVPSIDQNACADWTEQDRDLYNSLTVYHAGVQLEQKKTWSTYSRFTTPIPWKRNMGPSMRAVSKEPSPHIRQFALPNPIESMPMKDVIDTREISTDATISRHRFETPVFNFLPEFRDFFNDNIAFHAPDLGEKIQRYEDVFIRGAMFHEAPKVWLPGRAAGEVVDAPITNGTMTQAAITASGKSTAFLNGILPQIGAVGNLSLNTIALALEYFTTDMRALPFSGSTGEATNMLPEQKFALTCSSEAWSSFLFDPWLTANKAIDLNVVTERFKGSLFGRITCMLEDLPLRIAADGTFPDPEIRNAGGQWNNNMTEVSEAYKDAPYEVAFLHGKSAYKSIQVGPPPKSFTNGSVPPNFAKMFWNGEVTLTKNFLIQCLDAAGAEVWEMNTYGEHVKYISQLALGYIPLRRQWVLPIIFKRVRGVDLQPAGA
jgi:hypothetical protein